MQELIEQLVKEKRFLKNVTRKPIPFYCQSLKVLTGSIGHLEPSILGKAVLVVKLRESGLSVISCNAYIRGINSFLAWLYENEYTSEPFKIKQLWTERRIMQQFSIRKFDLAKACTIKDLKNGSRMGEPLSPLDSLRIENCCGSFKLAMVLQIC